MFSRSDNWEALLYLENLNSFFAVRILIYINAISVYLPERTVDNDTIIQEFYQYGGKSDTEITTDAITAKCGIKKRYVSDLPDTNKDLGNRAAIRLFEEYGIDKAEIDYLIFVRDSGEYKAPSTSCIMQRDLGLNKSIGTIDVQQGCTGYIYGISLSKALIVAGMASKVLLITGDVPTRIIHPVDIDIRSIFSDGASASLISKDKIPKGINFSMDKFIFGTDGEGEKVLYVERSAVKEPADLSYLKQHQHVPSGMQGGRVIMDSAKIFLFAYRIVPNLIKDLLEKHQMQMEEIDYFIFHQANGAMLEFLRKKLKIPAEKFINTVEDIGNTIGSSLPIAIKKFSEENNIEEGQKMMILGFGIGFSWGGTILTKNA